MSATTIRARWYSVDARGMATLCRDEADAIQTAADCSIQWPNLAPHRAVQLGDISALLAQHARDSAELRRLCQARDDETTARKAAQEQLYAENEANARLIAAAPDLLDALDTLCNRIELESATPLDWPAYTQARSAIAKAVGA